MLLRPSGHRFEVQAGESLLDAALRAGLAPAYRCHDGRCGECRARLVSGRLADGPPGDFTFPARDKAAGWFLLCQARAETDLEIEAREAAGVEDMPLQAVDTRVVRLQPLADDVLDVHLRTPRSQALRFLPGQYVQLDLSGLPPRAKSIASCPCNGMVLQFHVRRVAGDPFSERVFDGLRLRDPVRVRGPFGRFTLDEASGRPSLFLAFETGFAPIKSLIEHAISREWTQPMRLYWVTRRPGGHYLGNYCRSWEDALDDFRYRPLVCAGDGAADAGAAESLLCAVRRLVADCPDLSGWDLYASGPPALLAPARALLLAAGLPMRRLFVDELERFG